MKLVVFLEGGILEEGNQLLVERTIALEPGIDVLLARLHQLIISLPMQELLLATLLLGEAGDDLLGDLDGGWLRRGLEQCVNGLL